jgi:ligand-binding sensor domain-containing protein
MPEGPTGCSGARVRVFCGMLLLAGVFSAALQAQVAEPDSEFIIRNWDISSGLPANRVTAIQRTPEGYLWVGTTRGLARFDGLRFHTFTNHPSPLGTNEITSLWNWRPHLQQPPASAIA